MEFMVKKHMQSLFHFDLLRLCGGDPDCLKDVTYMDHPADKNVIVALVSDTLIAQLTEEQIAQLIQRY